MKNVFNWNWRKYVAPLAVALLFYVPLGLCSHVRAAQPASPTTKQVGTVVGLQNALNDLSDWTTLEIVENVRNAGNVGGVDWFAFDGHAAPMTQPTMIQSVGGMKKLETDLNYRVLRMDNLGVDFTLNNLEITGGSLLRSLRSDSGAAFAGSGASFAGFTDHSKITLSNLVFSNNHSNVASDVGGVGAATSYLDAGGALWLYGYNNGQNRWTGSMTADLTNVSFINNSATLLVNTAHGFASAGAYGGAGTIVGPNRINIDGRNKAVIQGNSVTVFGDMSGAYASGGGLHIQSNAASQESVIAGIQNITFIENTATNYHSIARGGALFLVEETRFGFNAGNSILKTTLTDVDFVRNRAVANGTSLENDAFGGAIFTENGVDLHINAVKQSVFFMENEAIVDGDVGGWAVGGAIFANEHSTLLINGGTQSQMVVFWENKAINNALNISAEALGGAIYTFNGGYINRAIFSGNVASSFNSWACGGAIFSDGDLTVSDSVFSGNQATSTFFEARGGAIYSATSPLTIIDSSFYNNRATSDFWGSAGGAIYAEEKLTIGAFNNDVAFYGNRADFGNSIYAEKDVEYIAAAERTISDRDGAFIGGDMIKNGAGTLMLENYTTVAGTAKANNGYIHFYGDTLIFNGLDTTGGGITDFDGSKNHEIHGVVVQNLKENSIQISGGNSGIFLLGGLGQRDIDAVNAAIDNTSSQLLYWTAAFGDFGNNRDEFRIRGLVRSQANMSDIRLSALMIHGNRTVFGSANDRMASNFNYWDTLCNCCNHCRRTQQTAWVNYVGRSSDLQSSYAAYHGKSFDISANGVQVGIDLVSNRNAQFGVMFGYEDGKSEIYSDRVKSDDYYFGIYGARRLRKGYDFRASFGYGKQDYDLVRWASSGNVRRHYSSSSDGDTYELNFELGRRIYRSRYLSFRPVIGFDFFWNSIDAGQEDPDLAQSIRYSKAKYNQALVRVGSDVQMNFGRLNINGGAYYSYDMADDDFSVGVHDAFVGSNLYGCDLGNSIISLNVGAQLYLNKHRTFAVYGGYNADLYVDRDDSPAQHTGTVGLVRRF